MTNPENQAVMPKMTNPENQPVMPNWFPKEVPLEFHIFYYTLGLLHKTMDKTILSPMEGEGKNLMLNLHKIFVEVISQGGIHNVEKEGKLQDVCDKVFSDTNMRIEPKQLLEVYKDYYMLDKYELLYSNSQTMNSSPLDPHSRTVGDPVSQAPALAPLHTVPNAGYSTTTTSTISLLPGLESLPSSSSITPSSAKKRSRPCSSSPAPQTPPTQQVIDQEPSDSIRDVKSEAPEIQIPDTLQDSTLEQDVDEGRAAKRQANEQNELIDINLDASDEFDTWLKTL